MHVYIWFQYCSHSNIPCMEINWSWEPPPARKLARVQVKTQKLMRVSWRVQVAHNPVLVVTVDTVKALKCWFDIVYIYIHVYLKKHVEWLVNCELLILVEKLHTVICSGYPPCQSRGWLWQPRVGKTSVQTSAVDRHDKRWGFSENMERGIGENVGTVAAPKYAMERKFVERYSKKMSGSSQKIKLLLIVFKCK